MGDKIEKEVEWTESYDADITRVDLVPNPANGVDFILAKSADGLLTKEEVESLLSKEAAEPEGDDPDEEDEPDDDEDDDDEKAAKGAAPELDAFVKAHGDHPFQYVETAEDGTSFVKRTFSAEQRRLAAHAGEALPDGSYPIQNGGDLHNAIHAIGRGSNHSHAEIHDHIVKRAKSLGLKAMLPKSWNQGGMAKSAEGTLSVDVDSDAFKKALEEATAPLRKAAEERDALAAELKKMAETPIPGGPMLAPPSGVAAAPKQPEQTENQKRAAHFRKMAEQGGLDAGVRDKYLEAAKNLESGS